MNYEECVEYLYKIPRFTKKAPLSQTEDFLKRLGVDLSMRAPKIIHVAGTNGKGSVCAYLDAALRADGYRTGLFTSPHLVRPEERIRIDGEPVSGETFVRCFEKVYPVAKAMERDGAGHPAFFSFVLGMAMTAFPGCITEESQDTRKGSPYPGEKEKKPDYIILETGMGGRLDNTNVFRHPAFTVITHIGLDHTQYLGDTREAIAAEKAGILKPGVPVVYLQDPVSAPVIEQRARDLGCPCRKVDAEGLTILEKSPDGIVFSMKKIRENTTGVTSVTNERSADGEYRIPFVADYQTENAALAIRAARELGCSEAAIREGLQSARWPGRMQEADDGFYVDGAHNVDGVRALLRGLDDLVSRYRGRRILLFGAVQDKDYEEMFRELADGFRPDLVVLTGLKTPRGVPVEELKSVAERSCGGGFADPAGKQSACGAEQVRVFSGVRDAVQFVRAEKKPEDFLLCAGSLYLVGEVLEHLQGQEIPDTGRP